MPPQLSSVAAPFFRPWGNAGYVWEARTAQQKPRRALTSPQRAQCVLGRIPTIWAGGGTQGAAAAPFGGSTLRLALTENAGHAFTSLSVASHPPGHRARASAFRVQDSTSDGPASDPERLPPPLIGVGARFTGVYVRRCVRGFSLQDTKTYALCLESFDIIL